MRGFRGMPVVTTRSPSPLIHNAPPAQGAAIFIRASARAAITNTSFENYAGSTAVIGVFDDQQEVYASSHLYHGVLDAPLRLFDGVSFHNLRVPAVHGARVAIANCEGLSRADFNLTMVAECADAGAVCPLKHCRNDVTEVGVWCSCEVAGVQQAATQCGSTAQMDVYIPRSHVSIFVLKKPNHASNEVALVNSGPKTLEWSLTEATHLQDHGVVWQLVPEHNNVPPISTQVVSLTAFSANLHARAEPYRFNFTLMSDNVCECDNERAITLEGLVFVSAALDPVQSTVALIHAARIVAGEEVRFAITPVSARVAL